jgi:transcriptional regulator with XRE-family HTH domain
MKNFAYRVKSLREKLGISQHQLAEKIGLSLQQISKIESRKVSRSAHILELANALGVSPDWLLFGRERYGAYILAGAKQKFIESPPNHPLIASYAPVVDWQEAGASIKKADDVKDLDNRQMIPLMGGASFSSFALIMQGDSMEARQYGVDSFREGEYLLFDPESSPTPNSYVLARDKNSKSAIFRKLIYDCGSSILSPHNSKYPIMPITAKITICAVLIAKYNLFKNPVNLEEIAKKAKFF